MTAVRTRLLTIAPLVAVGFLALASPTDDGPTICPFALVTGTACPGCGMTRAFGYLVRGDISSAVRYHPLVFLVAVQAAVGWAWLMLRRGDRVKPFSNRLTSAILVGTAVSLLVVWVVRMGVGALPPV